MGAPAKSKILWGEEEQGSERSFRRKAETKLSGLCDDEGRRLSFFFSFFLKMLIVCYLHD